MLKFNIDGITPTSNGGGGSRFFFTYTFDNTTLSAENEYEVSWESGDETFTYTAPFSLEENEDHTWNLIGGNVTKDDESVGTAQAVVFLDLNNSGGQSGLSSPVNLPNNMTRTEDDTDYWTYTFTYGEYTGTFIIYYVRNGDEVESVNFQTGYLYDSESNEIGWVDIGWKIEP